MSPEFLYTLVCDILRIVVSRLVCDKNAIFHMIKWNLLENHSSIANKLTVCTKLLKENNTWESNFVLVD